MYRNLMRACWSIRRGGRVVAHEQRVVLQSWILRVRESGRCRAVRQVERNVHAWVEGLPCDSADGDMIGIGYNPFLASTFTTRPGFAPVHEARIVVLDTDGKAYAVL